MAIKYIDKRIKLVIASLTIIILIAVGASLFTAGYAMGGSSTGGGDSSQNVPDNPRKSATTWLTSLMTGTSSKFGTSFFANNSAQLQKLMKGDSSFIPSNIKNSIELGSSTDDMSVSRTILNGASYAGLIMFANAYKQTVDKKISTMGYKLSSYDGSTHTVYLPAQAIISTDQNVQFVIHWSNGQWHLQGDPLAWTVYVMLESAASSGSSSSSAKK